MGGSRSFSGGGLGGRGGGLLDRGGLGRGGPRCGGFADGDHDGGVGDQRHRAADLPRRQGCATRHRRQRGAGDLREQVVAGACRRGQCHRGAARHGGRGVFARGAVGGSRRCGEEGRCCDGRDEGCHEKCLGAVPMDAGESACRPVRMVISGAAVGGVVRGVASGAVGSRSAVEHWVPMFVLPCLPDRARRLGGTGTTRVRCAGWSAARGEAGHSGSARGRQLRLRRPFYRPTWHSPASRFG